MIVVSRFQWTASNPRPNLGADDNPGTPYFRSSEVDGITFYTPDEDVSFVELNPYSFFEAQLKEAFKQGLSDHTYNLGVAPNVRGTFCLRGLCNKSVAHKDRKDNSRNVAVMVLVGRHEPPTDLLLENLISCREFILSKFPNAKNGLSTLPFSDFWDWPTYATKFKCQLPEVYINQDQNEDSNVHIFDLIENLSYWNYYRGRNDGVYGPVCRNAVMELQADLAASNYYMKRVDGQYGRFTREAFCRYIKELAS